MPGQVCCYQRKALK